MARPLVEVFSVEICPKSFPCQLYGDISIYNDGDDDDSERFFTLYERDYDHSEVISKDGQPLLLTGPDFPMSLPKPVISVRLWYRNTASDKPFEVICTGHLDNDIHNYYYQDKSCVIEGEHGYVRVNYIAMTFGVVAEISMSLYLKKPGFVEMLKEPSRAQVSDKEFPVYGTIVAHYGKTYGRTTCDSSVRHFDLLRIPSDESISLCFTNRRGVAKVLLARQLVAVPAYSTLEIDADLRMTGTDEEFFKGKVIYSAAWLYSNLHSFRSPTKFFSDNASLGLKWFNPSVDYVSLYSTLIVDKLASMSLDQKEKLPGWNDRESLLEVYSILIGREHGEDLSISGEISIVHSNSFRSLCLFNRDEKNAEELIGGEELLSIAGPASHSEFMMAYDQFYLTMKLKDANNHFNMPQGYIDFDTYMYPSNEYKLDKLLCTVIEGECGFCAVHYTVFSTAVGVQVKCDVVCKNVVDVANVYGKIVASYDMFDYSTFKNDMKYYGRVLFENDKDNVAFRRKLASKKAEESSTYDRKPRQVEFSTSYVAMPIGNYTLFLYVDLHLTSHSGNECFEGTLEFTLGGSSPMKIVGKDFDILVYVEMIPTNSWRFCDDGVDEF